jgi:tRNA uridine 5-carbamoylmethylation protein Kti12
MTEYRKAQKKIVYDVLSQIKQIFPVCDKDFYYMTMQEKLYNLAKKYGLIKTLRKYGVLD